MDSTIHIYTDYRGYLHKDNPHDKGIMKSVVTSLNKIKRPNLVFKIMKSGLSWAEQFSQNEDTKAKIVAARKEIGRMTSPQTFTSVFSSGYDLYKSVDKLKRDIRQSAGDLKTEQKVAKQAKKVFLNTADLINDSCNAITFLDKQNFIELSQYGYVPHLIAQGSLVTSAISTGAHFAKAYKSYSHGERKQSPRQADPQKINSAFKLAQAFIGCTSLVMMGLSLYFSIIIPSLLLLGIATFSLVLTIEQHFN